jgi:hypothetical protein
MLNNYPARRTKRLTFPGYGDTINTSREDCPQMGALQSALRAAWLRAFEQRACDPAFFTEQLNALAGELLHAITGNKLGTHGIAGLSQHSGARCLLPILTESFAAPALSGWGSSCALSNTFGSHPAMTLPRIKPPSISSNVTCWNCEEGRPRMSAELLPAADVTRARTWVAAAYVPCQVLAPVAEFGEKAGGMLDAISDFNNVASTS